MAVPVLSKTWQYDVNIQNPAQGTALADAQKVIRRIKTALIGFGTLPWTIRYSCDSVTAGAAGDGVDYWTTDAKLVWSSITNTGVRSWIVLKQTGIGTNHQVCIHLMHTGGSGVGSDTLEVAVSANAGFTGGTTSARPTATDEIVIRDGTYSASAPASTIKGTWWNSESAAATTQQTELHCMQSTDGQCSRAVICYQNGAISFWMFDKIQAAVTGLTYPFADTVMGGGGAIQSANDVTTYAAFLNNSSTYGYTNAAIMLCYMTSEGSIASSTAQWAIGSRHFFANDFDGSFPMSPVGIYSETTAARGRHGYLADLWFGGSYGHTGETYPNDTTRTFCTFGNMIHSWNGTTPVTA